MASYSTLMPDILAAGGGPLAQEGASLVVTTGMPGQENADGKEASRQSEHGQQWSRQPGRLRG